MRLRLILPSVIFLFCGLVGRAQVTEMYYQGFEVGETTRFTANPTGSTSYSTTYQMSGDRSLELNQSTAGDVTLLLDELDFTQNTSLRYISIEFDHICNVPANGNNPICRIFYKRSNEPETSWHQLTNQYYDMTDGGSSDFQLQSYFNGNCYSDWMAGQYTNDNWKSERFNLNDVITPQLAASERRLMIKFVVRQKTTTTGTAGVWRLDNIKINASSSQMIRPTINMVSYPEGYYHPSSRGARIELNASTIVSEGINADSVYLFYRAGSDPTPVRLAMSPVAGQTNLFRGNIPFFGYDTAMSFYCVVRDATSNANIATFPKAANSWVDYACVRGVEQPGLATPGFTGTTGSGEFPFRADADGRFEWVYDSALLANAGYGPGQMTAMRWMYSAHTNAVTRPRFQVKMLNAPTNYTVDESASTYPFNMSYMKVVYDGSMSLTEANTGGEKTLQFQDTFYYAGKDIVMQVTYDGSVNTTSSSIKMIATYPQKKTKYTRNIDADYNYNPFDGQSLSYSEDISALRPAMVLTQRKNLPLLYDMGFDTVPGEPTYGLVKPNRDVPMSPSDHSIQVRLKNQGALTVNAIRVSYSIDDTIFGHYDWTGSLAGGAVQSVTIAPNVALPAGFHALRVWVEDTLTASGQQYRDHEPYNDTIYSEFIVCDGAMHGVRHIGGNNADFNTIEEFLFAVSRCGIDDSLVVKLAPGEYPPFVMPDVYGLTTQHYIVFQPESNNVTIVSEDSVASMVDLSAAANIRFRNINFVRRAGYLSNMVLLGLNSTNCRFEGCSFIDSVANPAASMRIGALINTGYANNAVIDGCTFVGGKTGVDIKGQAADILSVNNTVKNSHFENQYECAVNASNQSNLLIEKNEMYDVLSNTNYVLLLNTCSGQTRVMANKVYTSHGAGAIGLNSVNGTSALHALVANNMVVCNDDGTANLMRSPFNVITANWTDVVYNSVKQTATSRNNIAAVSFGGGTLQNSRFVNNVVVSLDNNNYALNYVPGTSTTNSVGHNVYYSMGAVLNRRSGAASQDLDSWVLLVPADSQSVSVNPNFLNGSRVDLRTFNRLVKGVGIPLSTVTVDMFDTVRSTTATCPGAFEFSSLGYDFEPEALVSPLSENCHMPANVSLVVRLRNSGTNAYTGSGLSLGYQVNSGTSNTVNITSNVPAEDTVTIVTGATLQLPPNGTNDAVYSVRVWTIFANDPNQTNDTNTFTVISKYAPAKPNNDSVQIAYATAATITPTAGVEQWMVYNSTAAPRRKSEIYWYRDTTDAAPFFEGRTLTTDTIRMDTTFYFRQKRNKPIVRITQLEFAHSNSTVGLTPSMPYWMNNNRKVALQLTNVGDVRAYLSGDTLQTISPTANLNNKIFVFPENVYIEPGEALVVQYATGTSANPAMTIHTGSVLTNNVTYNSKIGFVYRHNGVIEDAVALNNIGESSSQAVTWANIGVPSYVWSGSGVSVSSYTTTAGIIRNDFNGRADDWSVASNSNPMFLNTIDEDWIRYTDNGCEGYFASYKVKLLAPPSADIDLGTPVLPESTCAMETGSVSVTVHNYGIENVSGLVLNYSAGGATVTETVPQTLSANGSTYYTFSTPMNLQFDHDSLVTVKVWADSVAGDPTHSNDTNFATLWVPYTPSAPASIATRTVSYGTPDTIALGTVIPEIIPVWYDYDGNPVDTGYTAISEILYVGGTRGVSYMVSQAKQGIVGTSDTLNAATSFPSPYQPKSKYAKQQYIYTANELRAAGLKAGLIDSLAFYFGTIGGNNPSPTATISFNEYSISLGSTSDTVFAGSGTSSNDWKATQEVYSRAPMVIHQSDAGSWVTHQFDTPYYWDGESSIVVQIVHYISSAVSSGARSAYTSKSNTTLSKDGSSALTPSTAEYVGNGSKGKNRPNIRFGNTVYGCSSEITPYTIEMINIPAVDMALLWPNGVDTIQYNSCNDIPIYVRVRNQGSSPASGTKVYYQYDNTPIDSITVTTEIASGVTKDTLLFSRHMMPGRHTVKAIVSAAGDNIHTNDTIVRSFMVRFCNGSYTIAATDGDYQSFGEAIDTLNIVGVQGPVVFNVAPGTYNEQVVLNNIPGSTSTHTIAFVGSGDDVLLTAATTQNDNYVMFLDSTSYVTLSNFRIEARPATGNFANALLLRKGGHITIDSLHVKVKGSVNNSNASAVVMMDEISDLTFTNNIIDSGYYSLRSTGATPNFTNLVVTGNAFRGFWSQGVNLRGVTNLTFDGNEIASGVGGTTSGRGLTGIYLAQTAGNLSIQKNKINLIDEKNGGKRGIQLENINNTASNPALVANNMISCYGTGTAGLTPAKPSGIWIDSSSAYVNIYFNTVRVYCGATTASTTFSENSYSFYSGTTVSNINVMNNIFSNFSKGYAYYVAENNTISISNYNAYFTESVRPFYWKLLRSTLTALQAANGDDANSVMDEPYFVANDDLHLVMTNFAGIAQYNADVPEDFDGTVRQQVPGPTIGAHEMSVVTHDMAVVRITEPVMPANLNFNPPNNMPPHIESDSVRVIAQFYNNGLAPESNVQWYAYLEGYKSATQTPTKMLGSFAPGQSKTDTVMMATLLGVTDTNVVHVVVILPADNDTSNNNRASTMYLAPAFNLAASRMSTDHTGCNMENTIVKIHVKNEGFKDFPAGTTFKIGYHPQIHSPAGITVSTLPDTVERNVTLNNALLMGQTTIVDFPEAANFYPTGHAEDIKIRLMGWVNYAYDITQTNDSTVKTNNTQSPIIDAYFTPEAPVGFDTILPYGTWGAVRAMQENQRPINWYRDSTGASFYHPTQYPASCLWSNTPQYFHDSVYYLNCVSTKNCASHFSAVHVYVDEHYDNDMAMEAVLAPLGGRVYMQDDTVRVRIANYGTRSQTNIPIMFELKKGTTVVQTVQEIIRTTIPAGQTYEYTFDSLLNISTPIQNQNYSLLVWTDLTSDVSRRNDTIRYPHAFSSLAENTYSYTYSSNPGFDITRVSFNEFDFECPPLGRGVTDLADFTSPDYPVVPVFRGLSDSLFVQLTPLDATAQSDRVMVWAFIDFNRNGVFDPDEELVSGVSMYDNELFSSRITISENASYGHMRMRVAVGTYADYSSGTFSPTQGFPSDKNSHFIDFLLYVEPEVPETDLAITQIVSPRSYLILDNQPRSISFRIANKGSQPISNPEIHYRFIADTVDSTAVGTLTYDGTLQSGTSGVLTIPPHAFPFGVTDLSIWHEIPDDAVESNNMLEYQYNRFRVVRPIVNDEFDLDNKWYAPRGYNLYSHNYWELGTPGKQRLNAAYSDPNAWVTDLNNNITTGKRGNVSYLYSPIINISQIRGDTISFRLRRNLTNGSSLRLEFYNYENKWANVNADSLTNWYNNTEDECFTDNTAGSGYDYYWIPSSLISGDFNENLQFRFVYTTPIKPSTTASFGEGCAIDNFHVGRARRPVDVGVVGITHPTEPAYGQTIYPKVLVHNYGTDTVRHLDLGYIHYGTYLPKESSLDCLLPPLATDTFAFTTPFVVTSDFPDTFHITAFTRLTDYDLYRDNDSCTQMFGLSPLENDISAHSFVYPLDNAVAGDSLQVTLRIRNFGSSTISNATATYIITGQEPVEEAIDFMTVLGRPLGSMEYFNYTFRQKFRASMGVIKITGIIKSPQNDYVYNDTVTKRIEAVNSVLDLAASGIIVDTSSHNDVRITLIIDNRGACGANGFEVGFYIDGDTNTMCREIYGRELPLPGLTTGYYTFDRPLPSRSAPYSNVVGFVHINGDNDNANDTTNVIASPYLDIELLKIVIIENAAPDCQVIANLRNNGNIPLLSGITHIDLNINGQNLSDNISHVIMPGQSVYSVLSRRIPKQVGRSYVGSATITNVNDQNPNNNQTTLFEVRGYWEDVPFVESNTLELDQNYPNPFNGRTTIPFSLPNDADVRFFIIDAMGHVVNSFTRHFTAGAQSLDIDMSAYSSGIYYYGIEVDGQRRMKKMIVR